MRRPKLAFIAHSFTHGGAQKYLYAFVRHCHVRGVECLVIGPRQGPQLRDFQSLGVKVLPTRMTSIWSDGPVRSPLQYSKIFINIAAIISALLRFRPDAVYTNTCTIISGGIASKLLGIPHYWHVHENFKNITLDNRFLIPLRHLSGLMEWTSHKVIFVSEGAMRSAFPQGAPKATVVKNGVDLARFHTAAASSLPTRSSRVCFIGELSRRRGIDTLLLALAALQQKGGETPCLDVWGKGDPAYSRALMDLIVELGLAEHVRLMGYAACVESVLPTYDALVVPSRGEAFPLIVLEGMAAGIPVIATRCGGPEEMIENGRDGLLVEIDDHIGLAGAIERILEQRTYAGELAKAAREKASRFFSLDSRLDQLAQIVLPFAK